MNEALWQFLHWLRKNELSTDVSIVITVQDMGQLAAISSALCTELDVNSRGKIKLDYSTSGTGYGIPFKFVLKEVAE